MRLASLYALLDMSKEIRVEHLSAALDLWSYCEQSAKYIFGNSFGDPVPDTIKRALDQTPEGMSRSEISSILFKRNFKASRIDQALNKLLTSGFAYKEKEEVESGRPSERWFSIKYQKS